jgi:OOP family OmpA-OmpF porin
MAAVRRLESGYAEITDRQLVVTGVAADEAGASELTDRLARIGGALRSDIDVVGPADWSATYEAGRMAIAGKVTSVAMKRAFVAAADLPFGAVTDESAVFSDMANDQAWTQVVLAALPHLRDFRRGRIALHGRLVRVTGEAPGSVIGYMREDVEAVSQGEKVDILARETEVRLEGLDRIDIATGDDAARGLCEGAFGDVMRENEVVFASQTARITRESGATLDKVVEVARRCAAFDIVVEGHTDDRGQRESNQSLSLRRARAVVDYMIARDVAPERLSAVGVGPDQPKASNRTSSGRAANRRIEFRVSARDERP